MADSLLLTLRLPWGRGLEGWPPMLSLLGSVAAQAGAQGRQLHFVKYGTARAVVGGVLLTQAAAPVAHLYWSLMSLFARACRAGLVHGRGVSTIQDCNASVSLGAQTAAI